MKRIKRSDEDAYKILKKVNMPSDLKRLTNDELIVLSHEINDLIINSTSEFGGHLGSNLGVIELTIALHYVFNMPTDKLIFDVSHQVFTHKILTGRKNYFFDSSLAYKRTFCDADNSEFDLFTLGHTSTSLSLALGLASGRDLNKEKFNVIALIGDGALTGGEAFEALNHIGKFNSNLIIILNDNDHSIDENSGVFYENLKNLRNNKGDAEYNVFKDLYHLDYKYIENGNDVLTLINILETIKDIDHPIVVHIHTRKGNGYEKAIENESKFHFTGPFFIESGLDKNAGLRPRLNAFVGQKLKDLLEKDEKVVLLTAAYKSLFCLSKEIMEKFKDRIIDVGIEEQHLFPLALGYAKANLKPIVFVSSYFIQRAYDQIAHDLSLNQNGVTVVVTDSGLSNKNQTHLGYLDIPMLINIPKTTYLGPADLNEFDMMLDYAINQHHQNVFIRTTLIDFKDVNYNHQYYVDYNNVKFEVVENGSKIAIISSGNMFKLAYDLYYYFKDKKISCTLINSRFLSKIDTELLENLKKKHKIIITLEDGFIKGGFGSLINSFYANTLIKVFNYGFSNDFVSEPNMKKFLLENRLSPELIGLDVLLDKNKK